MLGIVLHSKTTMVPTVAIANYGPHASLEAAIFGFKNQMKAEGFIEGKTIHYEIADVGFHLALIPQMLASLQAKHPSVMLVMTTPVAQAAKAKIHDIPLVYTVVTDPVDAGLIKERHQSDANMTGSSDQQDLTVFLKFVKTILPEAKTVGLLYATSESNDMALVNMMQTSAHALHMNIIAVPVEQARDVPVKLQKFNQKVDLIYVGASGPIQPMLPAIATEARKMHVPVFNMQADGVKEGLALASFGVDYTAVGKNAGKLAAAILHGQKINTLRPLYPTMADHHGVIHQKLAKTFGIAIPSNVEVVYTHSLQSNDVI
jgi:putative tryptophan/tyrosine transport system substrate-binding protein